MFDVITMGSATIDTFVDTERKLFLRRDAKIDVPFGTKINVEGMRSFTGGGGTNTAVAFSRLGLRTAYLGVVGDDIQGKAILHELKHEGVDTSHVMHGHHGSGQSVVLDSTGHDRIILTHKGCNDKLDVNGAVLSRIRTRWLYSSSLLNKSFSSFLKTLRYAKSNGIHVAFNPSSYQIREHRQDILRILSEINILVFNKEEAELLLGKDTVKNNLHKLYKKGIHKIAITNGRYGADVLAHGDEFHVSALKTPVVETTGAGDAFASGFVAGIIKTDDARLAASIGIANSASVVQYYGAKNVLLRWADARKKKVNLSAIR